MAQATSFDNAVVTAAAVGAPGNVVLAGVYAGVADFGLGKTPQAGPWPTPFALALDP
jgi:hypothetical protein